MPLHCRVPNEKLVLRCDDLKTQANHRFTTQRSKHVAAQQDSNFKVQRIKQMRAKDKIQKIRIALESWRSIGSSRQPSSHWMLSRHLESIRRVVLIGHSNCMTKDKSPNLNQVPSYSNSARLDKLRFSKNKLLQPMKIWPNKINY